LTDHYKIGFPDPGFKDSALAKDEVQFNTSDPKEMPVPNPRYLRLHAACAKIAYISGVGDLMDQWDYEIDNMDVLASDGSSMPLLLSRLGPLSATSDLFA
jgi:hypothetical protein